MKAKFLSFCFALILALPAWGQGQFIFSNIALNTSAGQVYYVPIWIDLNGNGTFDAGEGIGNYAAAINQTATLAVFLQGSSEPLASALFRSGLHGEYLGTPAIQDVMVPTVPGGISAALTVKAWIGPSFETASIRGSWDFLSQPLGGIVPNGPPAIPPTMNGWGDPSGVGFALNAPKGPIAGADALTRASMSDARISIQTLLANDSDANGSPITFVGVDSSSSKGAQVIVSQGEVVYSASTFPQDFFYYTVRNDAGGISRGRVDVIADDPDGLIVFSNQGIPMSSGSGSYNVPIFVDADFDGVGSSDEAFGAFASRFYSQPARLGLFVRGGATPLATASFRTDAQGALLGSPASQTMVVPGIPPGSQVDLTIKAWIGDSFETSRVKGSWDITSRPLGGVNGGQVYPVPGVTGWGNESTSAPYLLSAGAKPVAATDEIIRPYHQGLTINVSALLTNDSAPDGETLEIASVDSISHGGSVVTLAGSAITYKQNVEADDYFFYTVRATHGASAKGRVNVKASEPIGEITFSTRGIPKVSGDGTYDVPIWIDYNTNGTFDLGEGIGTFAHLFGKTAMLALYQQGSNEPIVTAAFGVTPDGFLSTPTTNVLIPGSRPGEQASLTLKAWVGDSFDAATVKKAWNFTSLTLGGPGTGGAIVPTPGLTGLGTEDGRGLFIDAGPPPVVGSDSIQITQGSVFPVTQILPNDSDPSGGEVILYQIAPTSFLGNAVFLFGDSIAINSPVGNDSFTYSIISSSGGLASGSVNVMIESCGDCGTTTGTSSGTSTSSGPTTSTGTSTSTGPGTGTTTATTAGTGTSTTTGGGPTGGRIYLVNQMIRRSSGSGVYNVPIWVDANFNGIRDRGEGIGAFASGFGQAATLGLFLQGGTVPIATARFRTNMAGAFIEEPGYFEVNVPSVGAGATVPLTLKAWIGADYTSATLKASWDFTSLPLGYSGQDAPDVSGWGNETAGLGYAIIPGAKPRTYGTVITRAVGQNVNAKIAAVIKNDSDPDGGALTFISANELTHNGAVVTVLGNTIYYIARNNDNDAPDSFEYTVRNAKGGFGKGRVDVVVTDADGRFNTLLDIESVEAVNHISFRGVTGSHYTVQYRDGIEGSWQQLGVPSDMGFGLFAIDDPSGNANRFYRVVTQP